MATGVKQDRRRDFPFDISAISALEDEAIAPDDEMRGTAAAMNTRQLPLPSSDHRRSKELSYHSRNSHNDDEARVPPPAEIVITTSTNGGEMDVTTSSSNHPDFEAWKRDMTEALHSGTVGTSTKSKASKKVTMDWKTVRLNKRRLEKKLLQQQLRSVKSDTSTTTDSVSSDDEHSTIACSHSFNMGEKKTRNNTERNVQEDAQVDKSRSSRKSKSSGHEVHTIYIPTEPGGAEGTVRRRKKSPKPETMSPRTAAFSRPTVSAVETPLSPNPKHQQPNAEELAAIMVELKDLKTWAQQEKHSSSPTSPKSPRSPSSGSRTSVSSSRPPSLPKSIVIPQLEPESNEENNKAEPIDDQLASSSKDTGIPTVLTIQTASKVDPPGAAATKIDPPGDSTAIEEKSADTAAATTKKKKKKKKVRFAQELVTDTIYRPKTLREDIESLYFQEEELLDWENDEETTLRDRFEVVVTDFGNATDETFTGTMSIGTPVISFHNSYSESFCSDDDSYDCYDVH